MITEQDLRDAIAECIGQKNPTANTCIKLAAFYTIKNELYPDPDYADPVQKGYSYSSGVSDVSVRYESESEFGQVVNGKPLEKYYQIMDELMASLQIVEPRLYAAVLRKFGDI